MKFLDRALYFYQWMLNSYLKRRGYFREKNLLLVSLILEKYLIELFLQ